MMTTVTRFLVICSLLGLGGSVLAQGRPRGNGGGIGGVAPLAPQFGATLSKLFGEHKAFSTVMAVEMTRGNGAETFSMPCQVACLDGRFRMEMDLAQSKGGQVPAGMTEQLKAMGMGTMTIISHEGSGVSYFVYPGLQSYAEIASPDGKPADPDKIKIEITEIGKETMNGHPCVKNKVVVTDQKGKSNQATVWNATDLKKFPVHIETAENNSIIKLDFKEVKFDKPDAKLFEPPVGFARYDNIQTMMQEGLMKRLGGNRPGQ